MSKETEKEAIGKMWAHLVAVYLVLCAAVLVAVLFVFWPKTAPAGAANDPNDPNEAAALGAKPECSSPEVLVVDNKPTEIGQTYQVARKIGSTLVLLPVRSPVSGFNMAVLVMSLGALGACLHGMTSLVYYLGSNKFQKQWTLWYMYRPFVGAILALIFYLVIAGGFMPQINTNTGGFYGVIGLAGLIGLFSKQALNTLSAVFDVIFTADKKNGNNGGGNNGENGGEGDNGNGQDEDEPNPDPQDNASEAKTDTSKEDPPK